MLIYSKEKHRLNKQKLKQNGGAKNEEKQKNKNQKNV